MNRRARRNKNKGLVLQDLLEERGQYAVFYETEPGVYTFDQASTDALEESVCGYRVDDYPDTMGE